MKKFFKYLGIAIILSISFFYTEKTATVVKELDDIMIKIREISKTYKVEPIEAIIENNTIIPGINGQEIDIDKSYREMRYIGKFNDKYLKYKKILIKNKMEDNLDKYIVSGNPSKKKASIVLIVDNKDNITNVLRILEKNEVSASFMISGLWLENNNNLIYSIANKNHSIGSTGYNYSYADSSYSWLDNVIKRVTKDKLSFCIKIDDNNLQICSKYHNYTLSSDVIKNNPLINTKKNLKNGSILIYDINDDLESELEFIIKYINSKDIDIVNIKELLEE